MRVFILLLLSGLLATSLSGQVDEKQGSSDLEVIREKIEKAIANRDPVTAIRWAQQGLDLEKKQLGPTSPEVIRSLQTLCDQSIYSIDIKAALNYARELQRIRAAASDGKDWQCVVDRYRIEWLEKLAAAPVEKWQEACQLEADCSRLQSEANDDAALEAIGGMLEIEAEYVGRNSPFYANSLLTRGRIHLRKQEHERAEELFREAIAIYEKAYGQQHPVTGFSRFDQAVALAKLDRHAAAVEVFQSALACFASTDLKSNLATTYQQLGYSLTELKDHSLAAKQYAQAASLRGELGDSYGRAFSVSGQGTALRQLKQHESAARLLIEAAGLFLQHQRPGFAASDFSAAGKSLFAIREYGRAIDCFERAHANYLADDNPGNAAWMLDWKADGYREAGDGERAVIAYQAALQAFEELENWKGVAGAARSLGLALNQLGKTGAAIAGYQQARDAYRKLGQEIDAAWMANWSGDAHANSGEWELALEQYRVAWREFEELAFDEGLAWTAFEMGKVEKKLANFRIAAASFLVARKYFEKLEQSLDAAWMCHWAGSSLQDTSDREQAIEAYGQRVDRFAALGNLEGLVACASRRGDLLVEQKDYPSAIADYERTAKAYADLNDPRGELAMNLNAWRCYRSLWVAGNDEAQHAAKKLLVSAWQSLTTLDSLETIDLPPSVWRRVADGCQELTKEQEREGQWESLDQTISLIAKIAKLPGARNNGEVGLLSRLAERQFRLGNTRVVDACCFAIGQISPDPEKMKTVDREAYFRAMALQESTRQEALETISKLAIEMARKGQRTKAADWLLFGAEVKALDHEADPAAIHVAFHQFQKEFGDGELSVTAAIQLENAFRRVSHLPQASLGQYVEDNTRGLLQRMLPELLDGAPDENRLKIRRFAARSFLDSEKFQTDGIELYRQIRELAQQSGQTDLLIESLEVLRIAEFHKRDTLRMVKYSEELATLFDQDKQFRESFRVLMDAARARGLDGDEPRAERLFQRSLEVAARFVLSPARTSPDPIKHRPDSWWQIRPRTLVEAFDEEEIRLFLQMRSPDRPLPDLLGLASWESDSWLAIPRTAIWRETLANQSAQVSEAMTWNELVAGLIEQVEFRQTTAADEKLSERVAGGTMTLSRSIDLARWLVSSPEDRQQLDQFRTRDSDVVISGTILSESPLQTFLAGLLPTTSGQQRLSQFESLQRIRKLRVLVRLQQRQLIPELVFEFGQQNDQRSFGREWPDIKQACLSWIDAELASLQAENRAGLMLHASRRVGSWAKAWLDSADAPQRVHDTRLILRLPAIEETAVQGIAQLLGAGRRQVEQVTRKFLVRNIHKQIRLAMMNYQSEQSGEIDAWSVDQNGGKLLSWRVHLLPYLGDEAAALYTQFKLNEPWDSEHNRRLLSKMPAVFAAPGSDASAGKTCLQLVTGPTAAWSQEGRVQVKKLAAIESIITVTVDPEQAVFWTCPTDYLHVPGQEKLLPDTPFSQGSIVGLSSGWVVTCGAQVQPRWLDYLVGTQRDAWPGEDRREPWLMFQEEQSQRQGIQLPPEENLRRIGAAMTIFELKAKSAAHPTLQLGESRKLPRYSVDRNGKPLLSWRVHLLPYLDQQKLYDAFHLDEPWDSEHNRKLLARMPKLFCAPGTSAESGRTRYLLVTGPGTGYAQRLPTVTGDRSIGTQDASPRIVATIVPEHQAVPWTQPTDLENATAETVFDLVQSSPAACLLDNRTVIKLTKDTPRAWIEEFLTPGLEPRSVQQKLHVVSRGLTGLLKQQYEFRDDESSRWNPQLSWRVHILPLIGQQELYQRFRLNEPWNSPHNLKLVTEMPAVYDPFAEDQGEGTTPCLRLVGAGTAAERLTRQVPVGQVNSQAIQVIVATDSSEVIWTKPEDHAVSASQAGDIRSVPLRVVSRKEFFHPLLSEGHSLDDVPESGWAFAFVDDSSPMLLTPALPGELWRDLMSAQERFLLTSYRVAEINREISQLRPDAAYPECRTLLPGLQPAK